MTITNDGNSVSLQLMGTTQGLFIVSIELLVGNNEWILFANSNVSVITGIRKQHFMKWLYILTLQYEGAISISTSTIVYSSSNHIASVPYYFEIFLRDEFGYSISSSAIANLDIVVSKYIIDFISINYDIYIIIPEILW